MNYYGNNKKGIAFGLRSIIVLILSVTLTVGVFSGCSDNNKASDPGLQGEELAEYYMANGDYSKAADCYESLISKYIAMSINNENFYKISDYCLIYQYKFAYCLYMDNEYDDAYDEYAILLDYEDEYPTFDVNVSYDDARNDMAKCQAKAIMNTDVDDVVNFGYYGGERIDWSVEAKDGNKVLLVAEDIVEYVKFNNCDVDTYIPWSESNMRDWLNSDFMSDAFTSYEQDYISTTAVKTTDCSDNTYTSNDRVFILDSAQIDEYGVVANFLKPTKHASRTLENVDSYNGCYVRDQEFCTGIFGVSSAYVPGVHSKQDVIHMYAGNILGGVRPAVWVDCSDID